MSCPVALCVVTDPVGGAELPLSRGLAMLRRFELPFCDARAARARASAAVLKQRRSPL